MPAEITTPRVAKRTDSIHARDFMATPGPDERPRVLIVDDEKFIRDILADFLGMEGYIVRTAEDGAAALNELHNAHYDLVISDLKMPRMGSRTGKGVVGRVGDA